MERQPQDVKLTTHFDKRGKLVEVSLSLYNVGDEVSRVVYDGPPPRRYIELGKVLEICGGSVFVQWANGDRMWASNKSFQPSNQP
jgi:hypothetical protein